MALRLPAPWVRYVLTLLAGFVLGAALSTDTKPRSLLNVENCHGTCGRTSDIAGYLASIGIQKFPSATPLLVKESDTCVAIRHPYAPQHYHFVFFPKRDIRNIGDISVGDEKYVLGCLAMIGSMIREKKMDSYRMYSNGPLEQDITYLHFHLVSDQ